MCGINGGTFSDAAAAERMNDALRHRGPDAQGSFADGSVTLGHTRLCVIDPSPAGTQPMGYRKDAGACSEAFNPQEMDRSEYLLVFNGEIYNYIEIRHELQKEGYVFSTNSDSEVILASYAAWGDACVTRFNGMWAFGLYDRKKHRLFCSRDRLGVKPFYYSIEDGQFFFSSELKGLLARKSDITRGIDSEAVELYFSLGYIPAPHTIYKGIQKLEPAHNLSFDLAERTARVERYWELPRYAPRGSRSNLVKEGKRLLADSVTLRLHADVPVGAFLSGGLDSSAVVAEMRRHTDASLLHTFSIGFEGKYDETAYIDIVKEALGTIHHHAYFTREDFEDRIADFATMYDEPAGDFSGFPTRKVSELAREYVTVALSGDGGDEVFGGYPAHVAGYRLDLIRKFPRSIRAAIAALPVPASFSRTSLRSLAIACRLSLGKPENFLADAMLGDGIRTERAKAWMRKEFAYALDRGNGSFAEAMRIYDVLSNTLGNAFLVKVDRASMFHALEVRSPFLDYRFYEFAQRIPSRLKAGLFRTKILMRDIIKDLLPREIVYRNKQGFAPPIADWIFDDAYLPALEKGIKVLERTVPELAVWYRERISRKSDTHRVYFIRLFLFQAWYERWVSSIDT